MTVVSAASPQDGIARRTLRAIVLPLALIGAAWSSWLIVFGGIDLNLVGISVTSNDARRTLLYTSLLLTVYILSGGHLRVPASLGLPARAAMSFAVRALSGSWNRARRVLVSLARIDHAVIAAVLAVALAAAGVRYGGSTAGGSDAYGYVSQADLWLSGRLTIPQPWTAEVPWPEAARTFAPLGYQPRGDGSIVPTYSPGLPLSMAGFKLLGGHCAAYWVPPFFAGILVMATYGIGRRLGSSRVGLMAAWLVATNFTVLGSTMSPMSDVPVAALWAVGFWLLLGDTAWQALVAGLVVSLGVLTRTNLAPMVLLPIVWLAYRTAWAAGPDRRRRLMQLAAFLAGAAPGPLVTAMLNDFWYGSPLKSGYGSFRDLYSWNTVPANLRNYTSWLIETQTIAVLGGVSALFLPLRPLWHYVKDRSIIVGFALFSLGVWAQYLAYFVFEDAGYLRFLLVTYPFIMIGLATFGELRVPWPNAWRLVVAVAVVALGVRGVILAERQFVFHVGISDTKYAHVAKIAEQVVPPNSVVVTMQHSGSLRHYGGRLTLRYDFLDRTWLDRAGEWLADRGIATYALLEDWEIKPFQTRFAGQRLGALAVSPVVSYRNGDSVLYIFDLNRSPLEKYVETIVETFEGPRCVPPANRLRIPFK